MKVVLTALDRSEVVTVLATLDVPSLKNLTVFLDTLARGTLGWEPVVPLDDGLTRTIAYFERMLVERGEKAAVAAE